MTTQKQINANRRNSLKSTGPITPEGKAVSSKNAFQHGMHSEDILLFHEDFDGYESFRTHLLLDQQPQTTGEFILIEQVLHSYFLARRCLTMMGDVDNRAIHGGRSSMHTYPILMKMKTQNDRITQKALQTLREIKQQREEAAAKSPQTKALPEIGFVPPIYPEVRESVRQVPYTRDNSPGFDPGNAA